MSAQFLQDPAEVAPTVLEVDEPSTHNHFQRRLAPTLNIGMSVGDRHRRSCSRSTSGQPNRDAAVVTLPNPQRAA